MCHLDCYLNSIFHLILDSITVKRSYCCTGQVMADCLRNSVVVRIILQHFSNSELLKLSLVNKLWNYEARSVMKIRGNLIACLKFDDHQPCQEYIDAFASDLIHMKVVPFSGIHIERGHCTQACRIRATDSTSSTILDQLPLKSLLVDLAGPLSKNVLCPAFVLVTAVLQHFSEVLEEVSLAKRLSQHANLMVWLDGNFPNLRTLKLLGQKYNESDGTYLISMLKAVIARAPKLEELHTRGNINLMLNVLEGRSAVFVHQSGVSAPFDEIPNDAINKIRLQEMLLRYTGPNFNVERFNRLTPVLLQAPYTATIHLMDVDAFLAVPLMCYGVHLENVLSFTMNINYGHLERVEPRILRFLKNFDFTRIFPNLDKVLVLGDLDLPELSPDHMNGFVEQANASLNEPQPDRAINIKELDLIASITVANAEFYAEMFPQIQRLRVKTGHRKISFRSIWKHWVTLEVLDVHSDLEKHYKVLESVICGIFPEEVAELRQKDEDFLKNVNIVPVMPAITCLKNLRTFVLSLGPVYNHMRGYRSKGSFKPPPRLILSKVTGLVATGRCPHLNVAIFTYNSHVYEGLRQMDPYATVYRAGGNYNCE